MFRVFCRFFSVHIDLLPSILAELTVGSCQFIFVLTPHFSLSLSLSLRRLSSKHKERTRREINRIKTYSKLCSF